MVEQRRDSLLDALEGRTRSLMQRLVDEREARRHAETVQGELSRRLGELEQRLAEAEASRLELAEENRELDEQNRELEAHNRHLLERLAGREEIEGHFRPGRRSQGLSALIGRRPPVSGPAPADPTPRHEQGAPPTAEPPAPAGDAARDAPAAEGQQDALALGEAPSPQALLDEWYARYPAAFFKGHTRPLMVGIHEVLATREPWPEKLVRRALACYVNLPRYLKAVRDGAERIDLDGRPAGVVDAQAADHARRKLDRLQGDKGPRQGRRHAPGRGKGKPSRGQGGTPGGERTARQVPGDAGHPPADSAPASLEEKLSALVAKHNGR
ncbi:MAG: ProQ/FINO family protein [Halomonas sp.]